MGKATRRNGGPPSLTPAIVKVWRRIAAVLSVSHLGPAAFRPAGRAAKALDVTPSAAFIGLALSRCRWLAVFSEDFFDKYASDVHLSEPDALAFLALAPLNLASLRFDFAAAMAATVAGLRGHACHSHITSLHFIDRYVPGDAEGAEAVLAATGNLRHVRSLHTDGAASMVLLDAVRSTVRRLTVSELPAGVERVDLGDTRLVEAGDFFLANCDGLAVVHLPPTLQRMGIEGFSGCPCLVAVDLSNTRLATVGSGFMMDCYALTSVKMPPTLRVLGESAFSSCSALARIDLANTVLETVGDEFMIGCASLAVVLLPATLQRTECTDWLPIAAAAFRRQRRLA